MININKVLWEFFQHEYTHFSTIPDKIESFLKHLEDHNLQITVQQDPPQAQLTLNL